MKPTDPPDQGPDTLVSSPEPRTRPNEHVEDPTSAVSGYLFGEVIGRGGIGEVVLAHDLKVGRDVAIKRLKADAPSEDEVPRFLRRGRIQARLAHPAIAPGD